MTSTVTYDLGSLHSIIGSELGPGNWLRVDQHRIDTFADATDDHQ